MSAITLHIYAKMCQYSKEKNIYFFKINKNFVTSLLLKLEIVSTIVEQASSLGSTYIQSV